MIHQNIESNRPVFTENPFGSSGTDVPIGEFHKAGPHNGHCGCLACHQKEDDFTGVQAVPVPPSAEDTGSNTSTQGQVSPGGFVVDQIETAGDNDWFSINLLAGETYTFTVYLLPGGLRDSILTLRDAQGTTITTNDDANVNQNLLYSEITFTATSSGTYFLDVSGFGSATGGYVLSSSRPVDDAIGDSVASSGTLEIDAAATSGALEQTGDRDWYAVTLEAGETYFFETFNTGGSNDVDTTLSLRNASGDVLAYNDDSTGTYSRIRFTATQSGTFYLDVGGWADGEQGDYEVSAIIAPPLREFTNDEIAEWLLYGSSLDENNIRRWDVTQGDTLTVNLTSLGAVGQLLAREALKLWTDVTGINFSEVSSGAQITFQNTEDGAFARSTLSGNTITSATVNVSTAWLDTQGTTLDSYSFQTYVHEVGHALGLRHPGSYNGDASYSQDAAYLNDSWATTVMSYFSQTENTFFADQSFDRRFAVTPMSADIVAAQVAYGASTDTRTGDTTYGVGNNSGRASLGVGDAATNNAGQLLAFVIVDNGGEDTVNYSTFSAAQEINLNAEAFSSVGGSTGNMSIARGTVIENAIAGSGNDTLIGNDVGNELTGGRGNDNIDGGSNVDVAIVSGNMANYTVTQTSLGVFQVVGADGTDTLTNVEFLQFDDQTMRLLRGTGVSVNFETSDPSVYQSAMDNILDFDGNSLGGNGNWLRIGSADVNGDGDIDQILVNDSIARFATVGTAEDNLVYFDDNGWAGETRVAGIYIDPLVESGDVERFGPNDSQQRFQNDLAIENINRVLGADDYDGDGLQDVYFALTDGSAYLRAVMEADGNIRYANYQSEQQVIDFLNANGFGEETYGDWFSNSSSQSAQAGAGLALVNGPVDAFALDPAQPADSPNADTPGLNIAQLYMGAGLPSIEENPLEFYG